MDYPTMQSALREIHTILQTRRMWLTFIAILAIFVLTGPFGTSQSMSFADRLLYWTVIQAGAWGIAISFSVIANVVLKRYVQNALWRMMIGSFLSALPIGLLLAGFAYAFHGQPVSLHGILTSGLSSLPLCIIFCLLCYMAINHRPTPVDDVATTHQSHAPRPAPPPLLQRLPPNKRGPVLRLAVQDHYTEIVTRQGRELVLLRFADAVRELGETKGLQVHRSHWVSDEGVTGLLSKAGRLYIATEDGEEIPVSRTYRADVQAHFADRDRSA